MHVVLPGFKDASRRQDRCASCTWNITKRTTCTVSFNQSLCQANESFASLGSTFFGSWRPLDTQSMTNGSRGFLSTQDCFVSKTTAQPPGSLKSSIHKAFRRSQPSCLSFQVGTSISADARGIKVSFPSSSTACCNDNQSNPVSLTPFLLPS